MSGFHEVTVGDVLTFQRGFDITKDAQSVGDIPVVSSSGISSFHNQWKAKGPGVVIGRKGTLGTVHFLKGNYWPHDTTLWVKDFKGNDPRFLGYFLQTLKLENFDVGASNPTLNRNHVHKLRIVFPEDRETQRKLAAILTTYDELAENNKQRMALLEKLAEEVYREWFVRLRFPGHRRKKTVNGIPHSWSVKKFGEIVDHYVGGGWGEDNPSTSFSDGAFVIRGTDIPDIQAGELGTCPFRFHKTANLNSRKLRPNDFVFEVSGGSKDQLLGRNVLITERIVNFFNSTVIPASFCKLLRFRHEMVSPYFMKYFLKLYYDYGLVGIYQVQSTGISNYQFESFLRFQTIVLPPCPLQLEFEDKVTPLLSRRDDIALTNNALRRARDLLVPRLMSGKLSVENLDVEFPSGTADQVKIDRTATANA